MIDLTPSEMRLALAVIDAVTLALVAWVTHQQRQNGKHPPPDDGT